MNIRDLIETSVQKNPDRVWLIFKNQQILFKELDDNINRVANGFLRLGVSQGDRVCLALGNCPEFLYSWYALNKIGAIMVPINPSFKAREIEYIITHSGAKVIITAAPSLESILSLRGQCPMLSYIVYLGESSISGCTPYSELYQGSSTTLPAIDVDENDVATIVYTSGTTGRPKGVMLPHITYVRSGEVLPRFLHLTPQDRIMTVLPLFHINAHAYSAMTNILLGATNILIERFSSSTFLDQVRHYGATEVNMVRAMMPMLLNTPEKPDDNKTSLRTVMCSYTDEVRARFEKRFGVRVTSGYSLTESPLATFLDIDVRDKKSTCTGKPFDIDCQMKIADENDKETPPGVTGQLLIKSPYIMKGYFGDKKASEEALKDGWLHTGDALYKGEDGFYYFVGRLKDMIRRSGENIAAKEVEDVINAFPAVAESAVVPVPDEFRGEEVKAYIILKPGAKATPEDIIAHCEANLASFKLPRYIEFRSSFPKTPTERVQKNILLQEPNLTACWDRDKAMKK